MKRKKNGKKRITSVIACLLAIAMLAGNVYAADSTGMNMIMLSEAITSALDSGSTDDADTDSESDDLSIVSEDSEEAGDESASEDAENEDTSDTGNGGGDFGF